MRRRWWLAVLLATGCASAPIKKADLAALAAADQQLLNGCYDCLLDARGIYQRLAIGKARPLLLPRLFEAQILIVLREKELAIDSGASMDVARRVGNELPPQIDAPRYLALVDAVLPDDLGTPRARLKLLRSSTSPAVDHIEDELGWLRSTPALREPVRQYLAISVDCSYLDRSTRPSEQSGSPFDPWRGSRYTTEAPPELPALVAYRVAICRRFAPKTLDRLRAGSPPFTEAAFWLARLEVNKAANSGAGHARELLLDVQRRFSVSASVSYVSANVNHAAGDCRAALPFYEVTLQLQPLHEDALLGRTMCLSVLRRTDEAIAGATHIIELKTDNISDAYYWLAWNHHLLSQLDPARMAIDHAKALATSQSGPVVETYTLAGIIEEEQHALVEAERDLLRAKVLARPARNCTADWYLGLVRLQDERWLDSAAHFEDAMHCYEGNVADDEMHLRAIQLQKNVDEDFKAQQIAGFQEAIKEDRTQQYASAFNAANQFSHGGNADKVRPLLDFAAEDPSLSTLVGQLRNILDGK